MVRPWKFGLGYANWKTACGTFNTCKEVFSLSTAPTFPHILVPIWSLSLTAWEVLFWDTLGVSASAPNKAHHRFVSRKTRRFFFLCSNYLGCLMLLPTCSAEPYAFHKRQIAMKHNLYSYSDRYSKIFRGKWSGRTIIPGILVPRDQFFRGPKFP